MDPLFENDPFDYGREYAESQGENPAHVYMQVVKMDEGSGLYRYQVHIGAELTTNESYATLRIPDHMIAAALANEVRKTVNNAMFEKVIECKVRNSHFKKSSSSGCVSLTLTNFPKTKKGGNL